MARAPQAIWDLFESIQHQVPSAVMSGIVGDRSHSFGYHLARNELPGTDYSVQLRRDRAGDAGSASALDVKFGPVLMRTVTARLLAAARAKDPRLSALREFCGTTDGRSTYPWDLSTGSSEGVGSWDSSHLWHVHLSFYRDAANNGAALAPIAAVIGGVTLTPARARKSVLVKRGDTLTSIAAAHHLTLTQLEHLNTQIHDFNAIAIDQRIFVS